MSLTLLSRFSFNPHAVITWKMLQVKGLKSAILEHTQTKLSSRWVRLVLLDPRSH